MRQIFTLGNQKLIREAKQESKTKSLVVQNAMQAEISNLDSDSDPAKPDKPKRSHIEKVFNKTIDRAVRPLAHLHRKYGESIKTVIDVGNKASLAA